jgi:hypothetical protein
MSFRRLELNGGIVRGMRPWRLILQPTGKGYTNAQIDDYGGRKRKAYLWRPGATLQLRARFSHPGASLLGTAGFGFWNAPFGDPTIPWPALPQAAWFFHASFPTDLPLPATGPGRGWFAATIDASTKQAIALAPFAPFVMLLNNVPQLRLRIWPGLRRALKISHATIGRVDMTSWHEYCLQWRKNGCVFTVDDDTVLETAFSPRGPLGFVCWIDNQYLIASPTGKLRWGTLPTGSEQWLEIDALELDEIDHSL